MMKRVIPSILLLLMTVACAFTAESPSAKISLKLNDVEVGKAFAMLTQQGGIPVIGETTVTGKVNCSLNNVTVEQALDVICKLNKLSWIKVYATPEEKGGFSPSKLFKLYDALAELGQTSVICENPKTSTQTAFVSSAKIGTIGPDAVKALNLKPVYIVRIMPEITAAKEAKVKKEQEALLEQQKQTSVTYGAPPADPHMAAERVWDYFSQMSPDQRRQVMGAIRQRLMDNLSPEQRQQIQDMFGNRANRQQQ